MSEQPKLGRRGFLGVGVAAAAGVGLAGKLAPSRRGTAHFTETHGFPDRPVAIEVTAPTVPDGAVVVGTLVLETPTERLEIPIAPVAMVAGRAQVPVTLAYPYETRVPGSYRYQARLQVDGLTLTTPRAATYDVRRVVFFS